ncbi:MAG: VOC family protein [Dehalococcoidia bacterium]
MTNAVVHFEIIGKDGAKLQGFYRDLFGWRIDANNPMNYGLVDNNDAGIGGGIGPGEGDESLVTFYIGVDDLQAALDKAEQLGGKTVMPITEIPGMVIMAQFADPAGNVIGLVKNGYPS